MEMIYSVGYPRTVISLLKVFWLMPFKKKNSISNIFCNSLETYAVLSK